MIKPEIPLTSLAHGAGCGCKISAASILPIVRRLGSPAADERLLVGANTVDDAAVFQIADDLALVQTIDFFTPIVDDPYDFGRIAATNALSDVYAMGGEPLTALNIVAFPLATLGDEVLFEILRGGADVAAAAGALIVGGHSIDDSEPKYGLAVTGTVDPQRILTNAGGQAGDVLVLSKPIGIGAITTAFKRGACGSTLLDRAVKVMTTLNADASHDALAAGAVAATDITGFGLLGHLHSMAMASGLAAEISAVAVPAIDGVLELLSDDQVISGGSARNREHGETFTAFADTVPEARRRLLADAQTSGGLLVALPADAAAGLPGSVVGALVEGRPGTITVV